MARSRNSGQRQFAAVQRAMQQEAARAAREAERLRKEAEKQRAQQILDAKIADADRRTAEMARHMEQLTGLLRASLRIAPPRINFEALKATPKTPPLDPGPDATPSPAPDWHQYEPKAPGVVSRMFGGEQRHARELAEAKAAFASAQERHTANEAARRERVAAAQRRHLEALAAEKTELAAQHARVDRFVEQVREGDPVQASKYFKALIDAIGDPAEFPKIRRAGYVPDSTLLAIEWYLPKVEIVPAVKTYRYIKARDAVDTTARPITEIRAAYQQIVAQVALRALRTVFEEPFKLVDTVVFNGLVDAIDRTTGQAITPYLITLRATRTQYTKLVLDQVDAVQCVRKYFAAEVSRHPDELEAVLPLMNFDMADPRVITPVDVISGMDKRPNLMDMTPKEFEYFAHNLFTLMGFDTKLFEANGDGGVDCIAYDPTPIRGGKYVIQVKKYARKQTVRPTAVRDLYGTMQHEGATKGILITTSGFGPSSYDFANGKPLQLIDGHGLLALCRQYSIPARIL